MNRLLTPALTKHRDLNYGTVEQIILDTQWNIEMIKYAGTGVAMGNGHPELKAAASFITSTNDADGVAEALDRFVLEEI